MTLPADKGKSAQRNARLKAALRENLRRRKAQERGRSVQPPAASEASDTETAEETPPRER